MNTRIHPTDDPALVNPLIEQFDSVWRGDFCHDCGRRDFCGDCPVDDQILNDR